MIIKAFKYARYSGSPREWRIVGKNSEQNDDYVYFNKLNLLVSRNGGGKSRTLNVIRELAELISSKKKVDTLGISTQYFDFLFEHEEKIYNYVLNINQRVVEQEILSIDGVVVLNKEKKLLKHHAENIFNTIDTASNDLLIASKVNGRPVFAELVLWGKLLRNLLLLDSESKNTYIQDMSEFVDDVNNIEDPRSLIPVFHFAREKYGSAYVREIIECMQDSDYNITDIDIRKTKRGYGIHVEEDGKYYIEQYHMSMKMFRTLSLFVVLLLARREKASLCILVDDIGEGIDSDTSKKFMDVIIQKSHDTLIQYFMTSNNRYIMNNVHLRYWSIIEREGTKSIFYNINNSRENFEDFKYTSLNNCDFFTTDFYKNGFGEDDDEDELGDEEEKNNNID